jgi:hypothetical protein
LCEVCGGDVEELSESQLYLSYVIGELDPELLHTTRERHIRCNPVLAQFIVDPEFDPVRAEAPFDKRLLDSVFVAVRERLVTRGYQRLQELRGTDLPILEYPLPEVREAMRRRAETED